MARGLPTGGEGSKVYVLCAEPKEHKHFRPGTRPGGSVTGVTEKLFMCQMFMSLFRPLSRGNSECEAIHGVLQEVFWNSFRKVPAVLGVWPITCLRRP